MYKIMHIYNMTFNQPRGRAGACMRSVVLMLVREERHSAGLLGAARLEAAQVQEVEQRGGGGGDGVVVACITCAQTTRWHMSVVSVEGCDGQLLLLVIQIRQPSWHAGCPCSTQYRVDVQL